MNNYDKYFDLIEGKLKSTNLNDNIAYDFRNLVLTYYEYYIGKVDIVVKGKFFGLIKYCLQGKTLEEATNYKTEKDFEILRLFSKQDYKNLNDKEGNILKDIYLKYKDNPSEWNIFKSKIKSYSL